jgi:hypothetical protein
MNARATQRPAPGMVRRCAAGAAWAVALVAGEPAAVGQCQPQWRAEFPGSGLSDQYTTNVSAATIWDPDGAGPLEPVLVLAGTLDLTGIGHSVRIATWDGQHFGALPQPPVGTALVAGVYNGSLVLGGYFTPDAGPTAGVVRLSGGSWEVLGRMGNTGRVQALTEWNGGLVASGSFQTMNGVGTPGVAFFDGSNWAPIGAGLGGSQGGWGVMALQVLDGTLWAGGDTQTSGATTVGPIARWTGSAWEAPAAGASVGWVNTLGVHNGQLHAGGSFTQLCGASAARIASWNGAAFQQVGSGVASATVESILSDGGQLYIAGSGVAVRTFSGGAWSQVGGYLYGNTTGDRCSRVLRYGGQLLALGNFDYTPWPDTSYAWVESVAKLDRGLWRPITTGFSQRMRCAAVVNGRLWAGGGSRYLGAEQMGGLAYLGPGGWQGVGTSLWGEVYAMAPLNGGILFGGQFSRVEGQASGNLAFWDGVTLAAFPQGLYASGGGGSINCFQQYQGSLYAGGYFYINGDTALARWTGSSWQSIPVGGGSVADMAVHNGELVIAGAFQNLPGLSQVYGVAAFNGTSWRALGAWPIFTTGYAVESVGGELWGMIKPSGGSGVPTLYRWNGVSWDSQGQFGYTLSVWRGRLVAHTVSGTAVARTGTTWTTLGGAVPLGSVYGACDYNGDLVTVGAFDGPDASLVSPFITRYVDPMPALLQQPSAASPAPGATVQLSVLAEGPAPLAYAWQRGAALLNDGPTAWGSVIFGAATDSFSISNVQAQDAGAYSCIVSNSCGGVASDAAQVTVAGGCYANCDGSTGAPILNVADFSCFLTRFASGDAYANCDGSTAAPVLNVQDFSCFLTKFATGCP